MKNDDEEIAGTRHPELWVVEAVRWEFKEGGPSDAIPRERPGVELGESIARAEVPDRPFALAIAHHLVDRHAEEAAGRMSLEIHIHPPQRDVGDESLFRVGAEVLEQAHQLGLEGDVEQQVKRMACDAKYQDHPKGYRQFERFLLQIEGNVVTWIGVIDPQRGRRRPPR